jgi:DNA-binding XRE family transcriptional regulator
VRSKSSDADIFAAVCAPETSGLYGIDIRPLVSEWARQCGKRVGERRVSLGLDRRHVAVLAATTEPTIHRIENGCINPRDHLRFAISAVLGSDVSDLWSFPSYHDLLRAGV